MIVMMIMMELKLMLKFRDWKWHENGNLGDRKIFGLIDDDDDDNDDSDHWSSVHMLTMLLSDHQLSLGRHWLVLSFAPHWSYHCTKSIKKSYIFLIFFYILPIIQIRSAFPRAALISPFIFALHWSVIISLSVLSCDTDHITVSV